ncbi:uncharacterized protein LOC114952683 [Acropora millepora]|uniref:uncharacterized protein LOC114952683 n=1 Tax=Acropora millepora TaxID=45264 RepID=UPI001CF3E833|nr:uncharacterized protein LOC114952683 [Acropora millepora]
MSSKRRNLSALVFHNRHVPENSEHALELTCSTAAQGLAQSFFSPAARVALRFQSKPLILTVCSWVMVRLLATVGCVEDWVEYDRKAGKFNTCTILDSDGRRVEDPFKKREPNNSYRGICLWKMPETPSQRRMLVVYLKMKNF